MTDEINQYKAPVYKLLRGLRRSQSEVEAVGNAAEHEVPKKRKTSVRILKDGHHVIAHCIRTGEIYYEKVVAHEVVLEEEEITDGQELDGDKRISDYTYTDDDHKRPDQNEIPEVRTEVDIDSFDPFAFVEALKYINDMMNEVSQYIQDKMNSYTTAIPVKYHLTGLEYRNGVHVFDSDKGHEVNDIAEKVENEVGTKKTEIFTKESIAIQKVVNVSDSDTGPRPPVTDINTIEEQGRNDFGPRNADIRLTAEHKHNESTGRSEDMTEVREIDEAKETTDRPNNTLTNRNKTPITDTTSDKDVAAGVDVLDVHAKSGNTDAQKRGDRNANKDIGSTYIYDASKDSDGLTTKLSGGYIVDSVEDDDDDDCMFSVLGVFARGQIDVVFNQN